MRLIFKSEDAYDPAAWLKLEGNEFQYLSPHGFDEGSGVLPSERPFAQTQAELLASKIGDIEHNGEVWSAVVGFKNFPYVRFHNVATEESCIFYDLDIILQRKIQLRI